MNETKLKKIVNYHLRNMSSSFKAFFREDFYQEARIVLWLKKDAYNEDLGASKETYENYLIWGIVQDTIKKLIKGYQYNRNYQFVSLEDIDLERSLGKENEEIITLEVKQLIDKICLDSLKPNDVNLMKEWIESEESLHKFAKDKQLSYDTLSTKRRYLKESLLEELEE